MKTHGTVIFTVLLLASLIACGSSLPAEESLGESLPRPVVFTNYTGIFTFIARYELLPIDADTLFTLAADSRIDRSIIDGIGQVMVIESNYYGGGKFNRIRGAQLNGRYFVLRIDGDSFRLIGVLSGNAYRWDNVGSKRRLITSWHLSAAESPETTYTWDGAVFVPFSLSMK